MRPSSRVLLLPALTVALVSLATAQRTIIVDRAGGSGTDYRDLPPAVAAAKHGDILVVRRGLYSRTRIGKGIAVVGLPGAELESKTPDPALEVHDLPRGQTFRLRGFLVDAPGAANAILIRDSAGSVHLYDTAVRFRSPQHRDPQVLIRDCKGVTLNNCRTTGGLAARRSVVDVTSGHYTGVHGTTSQSGPCTALAPTPAVDVAEAELRLSGVRCNGGNGTAGCSSTRIPGAPGVVADASSAIAQGNSCLIAAGTGGEISMQGRGACSLELDGRARFTGRRAGFRESTVRVPTLTLDGGALGEVKWSVLSVRKGQLWAQFESVPAAPIDVAPFGLMWMDLRYLVLLRAGVATRDQLIDVRVPMPRLPALRGLAIIQQAIAGDAREGFRLSNAPTIVIR